MNTSVVQSSVSQSVIYGLFLQRNMVAFTYRLLLHKSHMFVQQNVCMCEAILRTSSDYFFT